MNLHTQMLTTFLACAAVPLQGLAAQEAPLAEAWRVYIGTYTGGDSEGIYLMSLDPVSGTLGAPVLAAAVENPSFLALHPEKPLLYAVGELGGEQGGTVSAFSIDPATGLLTLLNQQSSRGDAPCHVAVDRTGNYVLVANYSGGSVSMLPITDDGRLGPVVVHHQHQGASVNPKRQEQAHAHSVTLDAANRFAFVGDLGMDQVVIYRLDAETGALTPNDPAFVSLAPGAGPRHFAFHPSGRYAYVINEMGNTVTAFQYNRDSGVLETLQSVPTLPNDYTGESTTAEVRVHPSGKFLYGSNRGHDSIAIFQIDPESGKLTPIGHTPSGGKTPRNFNLTPGGKLLLAANQNSHNVVVFEINQETGALTPTPQEQQVHSPVCVLFQAAPGE